jgi:hypothetical protein
MRHPPYHLRPNKAVDRLALVEAVRRLEKLDDLVNYTYYGFGGPYLEDFRLLYDLCPGVAMVSIERDEETYKRQEFHRPCGSDTLRLETMEFGSFLAQYEAQDRKSIFWLDYTGLEYCQFEDFMTLLGKVAAGSMVKITLRAEPQDYIDRSEEFRRRFEAVMPDPSADPPVRFRDFATLLQGMLQVAAQNALPGAFPLMFQPVSSFCYSDGTGILTLTGLVCRRDEEARVRKAFQGWQFANLNWTRPRRVDVPVLSTKERLHLQSRLPCSRGAGRTLRQALGYLIDDDQRSTESKLKQYAEFHRYSPYFIRAVP